MSTGHTEENETVLFNLKKSRKAYLPEYGCAFVLLILLIMLRFKGLALSNFLIYLALVLIIFSLTSAEISRLATRYVITTHKIIVIKGFLKQSKKNVYFHSLAYVPDINISQHRWQRLLGIGKIYIHGGSMGESLSIDNIDHPAEVLKMIEKLVHSTHKNN
ncbi:PH domain-containing protein [Candidatus Woesearchaeota archaeon]|nr:PH domain-containing protein [Candidatus Woesearchaeota archaeon]